MTFQFETLLVHQKSVRLESSSCAALSRRLELKSGGTMPLQLLHKMRSPVGSGRALRS